MMINLGNVRQVSELANVYEFKTEKGALKVEAISDTLIRFDYSIDCYIVPQFMEDASRSIYELPKIQGQSSLKDSDSKWIISIGETMIQVDKINAIVSVLHKGVLVHGGKAGGKDTVIPQSQFRLLGSKGAEFGRFNFAMTDSDHFFGLGDKAGNPDHKGKRLKLYNKDSLGYDAEYSDPLYKSIPFVLKFNHQSKSCSGLFITGCAVKEIDLGKESPFYYGFDVLGGPFSVIIILGNDYKDIVRSYCTLTGKPAFPPLYSFGYFGSSMNYVEAWNAQSRMEKFFSDVEEHDLPCEGLYVSSGYLKSDDGFRHSFMWNRRKFPDPKTFLESLENRGYHLTFNIKPGILKTHPFYKELLEKGYFIKDNDGKAIVEYFWGGDASFIDFKNLDAKSWWKGMLNSTYLEYGVDGIWNDNNECEIEDEMMDACKLKALYPVQMAKASWEACTERNPGKRPWIYSRSGYAGIQRYARTWTGDNTSTFKTLRFNQFQGATMGISGMPYVGHDLGGFFGPEPSEELLVRCAQSAIFQCRFVIHSWRENDEPTEPWKFPKSYELIKEALFDHYRHMPYIYNQAHEATSGTPIERLLYLEYPNDPNLYTDIEEFLFGPSVLKAPVLNESQNRKVVYFPQEDNWYSPRLGVQFYGGDTVDFETPIDTTWYFYKVGSVIPKTSDIQKLRTGYFPNLQIFVLPKDGFFSEVYYEDDGVSIEKEDNNNKWVFNVSYNGKAKKGDITINYGKIGDARTLEGRTFSIILPTGFEGETEVDMARADGIVIKFKGEYRCRGGFR